MKRETKKAKERRAIFNLKFKFVLILSLSIAITGAICGTYIFFASKDQLKEEMKTRGTFMATYLAHDEDMEAAIKVRQRAFFNAPLRRLRQLDSEEELAFCRVILASGQVIAQETRPWMKTSANNIPLTFASIDNEGGYIDYYFKSSKERLHIFHAPVIEKGVVEEEALAGQFLGMPEEKQFLATVQIALTQEKLNKEIMTTIWLIIVPFSIAVVAGGIAIYFFVAKLIVNPIQDLRKATDRVASGDWTQEIPVKKKDEIGLLASSLNHMTANLKKYLKEKESATEARQKALADAKHSAELSELKSNFLSTVSHELRTPLTSIMGFTKLIQKKFTQEIAPVIPATDVAAQNLCKKMTENMAFVLKETERLSHLLDDLLDLSKIEAGKVEWHMQNLRLRDLVTSSVNAFRLLIVEKGLRIETKYLGPDCMVYGDRDRLVQVIINLLSNAMKYTAKGGITCSVEASVDTVKVSVIDTGTGIDSKDIPKLFRRFIQAGDTLPDKPKGTGLGLAICKEIVEHHGGSIFAESQLGIGSTFSFVLPIIKESKDAEL
ncbi:MAG: sensor histidine kinase [Planctomycetota bacterium]|jgi:signal transduction histidine kinase